MQFHIENGGEVTVSKSLQYPPISKVIYTNASNGGCEVGKPHVRVFQQWCPD